MASIPAGYSTDDGDAGFVVDSPESVGEMAASPSPAGPVSGKHSTAKHAASLMQYAVLKEDKRQRASTPEVPSSTPAESGENIHGMSARAERAMSSNSWLMQLAMQVSLLLSSWVFLAFLHPTTHSMLLLIAISLTRLHLGWLVCCIFSLLFARRKKVQSSQGNLQASAEGKLAAVVCWVREMWWSQLPLRYWHCVFYLALMLTAFWSASVVQEDSHEGLQPLQGGGGASFPYAHAWVGGSLPPLLLNSDSPQHVKVAATAVARGREASNQLRWLLHTTARQHYGKLIVWVRTVYWWLDTAILRPFLSLLRHAGFLTSSNGTCSLSDAPDPAAADSGWWWMLWVRDAIQKAVRSLPSAAQHFICGDSSGSISTSIPPGWLDKGSDAQLGSEGSGGFMDLAKYCSALLLLLVHALATILQHSCLAIFSMLGRLLAASGIAISATTADEWWGTLVVSGTSGATSFAVTFVLLSFLHTAAAAVSSGLAMLASVGFAVHSRLWLTSRSNDTMKRANKRIRALPARNAMDRKGKKQGAVTQEILAAASTCWLLLLADRNFVMFLWGTTQHVRLSVLSALLLLRLPPTQVATLLSWPPPLREPALQLQRSQPLRIIDPVAVGCMVGCVLAAVVLNFFWSLAAKLFLSLKNTFSPASTAHVESGLGPLSCTRGSWTSRTCLLESNAVDRIWPQPSEQSHKVPVQQELLFGEQHKNAFDDQLRTDLQVCSARAANRERLAKDILKQQAEEVQNDISAASTAWDDAVTRKQKARDELERQEKAMSQKYQEVFNQKQQSGEQQEVHSSEQVADLRSQLCDSKHPQFGMKSQLIDPQHQAKNEKKQHIQKQSQAESEIQQQLVFYKAAESTWKQKQTEQSALLNHLQKELLVMKANLQAVTQSRDEVEGQLKEVRRRYSLLEERAELIVKNHCEDLTAKRAEINTLRAALAEVVKRSKQDPKGLRSYQIRQTVQGTLERKQPASGSQATDRRSCSSKGFPADESPRPLGPASDALRGSGSEPCSDIFVGRLQPQGGSEGTLGPVDDREQMDNVMKLGSAESLHYRKRLEENAIEATDSARRDVIALSQALNQTITCSTRGKKLSQDLMKADSSSSILDVVERETCELKKCIDLDEQQCHERKRQLGATERILLSYGIDQPPPKENPAQLESGRKRLATHRRGAAKVLTEEEASKLSNALVEMNSCSFPITRMLKNFEMPQAVYDAANRLGAATVCFASDYTAVLVPSECDREQDVKTLASQLRLLQDAWPSDNSCARLRELAGEADTLSPIEQKFLPFAQIRHGRQLLTSLLFVLNLGPEWEEERLRLVKLTEALQHLRESETLRRLYEICAEIHEEMRWAACTGGHDKTLSPKGDPKQQEAVHFQNPASQMWKTGTELNNALKQFSVYGDNGELNFGCLWDAAGIQPSQLPVKSLLQVVLLRLGTTAHSQHQPCQSTAQECARAHVEDGESARHRICQSDIPNILLAELHMDSSSTETSIMNGFIGLQHSSARDACRCRCAACRELGTICGGRLRNWQKLRILMKSLPFLGTASKSSRDPSIHGNPRHFGQEDVDDKEDSEGLASTRLENATAIAKLYYDTLSCRQEAVAGLGRRIRNEFKEQSKARNAQQNALGATPRASLIPRRASVTPSEMEHQAEPHTSPSAAAPPTAIAACRPGHILTDTERDLENACRLVEEVHSTVRLIQEAWNGLLDKERGSVIPTGCACQEMSRWNKHPQETTAKCEAVATQQFQTADSEPVSRPALLAKTAAVAAGAAARAQMILKGAKGQYASVPPLKAACSRDDNSANKTVQQQQHAPAYKTNTCNGSGIPCPVLPSRQGHPAQFLEGNQRQPHAARLAYSKSASCSAGPDGKGTSASPPLGDKELLTRQRHSKTTTATTAKCTTTAPTAAHQRQGRAGLCLQPANALISLPSTFGGQVGTGKLDPTKVATFRNETVVNGQQNSAAAPRRLRHASTSDLSFTAGVQKASDNSLTASVGLAVAKGLPSCSDAEFVSHPPTDGGAINDPDGVGVQPPPGEKQIERGTSGARPLSSPTCENEDSGMAFRSPIWTPRPEKTNVHQTSAAPVAAPETNHFNSVFHPEAAGGTNDGNGVPSNDTSSNSSRSKSDGNVLDIGDNDAVHFSPPDASPIPEADSVL